jgi:hypothetical protein
MADRRQTQIETSAGASTPAPPTAQTPIEPARFGLSRWIFLRGLGLVYLTAFLSAWVQIHGLVGSRGIVPVADYLAARQRHGLGSFAEFPTLCWLDASDRSLSLQCAAGVGLSCLVVLGVAPAPALALLWLLHLSITTAGNLFFAYQWDTLLQETGLLAIFYAPATLLPRATRETQPSRLVRWLLLWLLFRLIFGSGISKLMSHDPTWRDLTALQFHYETQPLPPWTAWYAHQLPGVLQRFSCLLTLVIELLVPWFVLGSRRCRLVMFAAAVALQMAILLTGNFGFFNLLTIVLCVPLLDDAWFPASLRRRLGFSPGGDMRPRSGRWPGVFAWPLTMVIVLVSLPQFLAQCGAWLPWPGFVVRLVGAAEPFRSINTYGLFAIMTTTRVEIIVEGSDDGVTWRPYQFRWKPGDPRHRPSFCVGHLPRLDWQMWFAALSPPRDSPWLTAFLRRLSQGSPEVLALLWDNPFPERPPRMVRASYYEYRFTDRATRRATGAWWARKKCQES